jgi:hypothetical protein
MPTNELIKPVMLTEEAHNRLAEAAKARYGTTSIRWSDVIQTWAEEEISHQGSDN